MQEEDHDHLDLGLIFLRRSAPAISANMTCRIYGQTSSDTHGLFLLFKAEMYNTDGL
jgi:hypothetical protein